MRPTRTDNLVDAPGKDGHCGDAALAPGARGWDRGSVDSCPSPGGARHTLSGHSTDQPSPPPPPPPPSPSPPPPPPGPNPRPKPPANPVAQPALWPASCRDIPIWIDTSTYTPTLGLPLQEFLDIFDGALAIWNATIDIHLHRVDHSAQSKI